ncbi:protein MICRORCHIDIA 7-like [Humulus lupulus]|uniref:protein MICRORCHIDIA 7-like n=1 Tax=Humulus lupulus TaxID=3486 RepID=UPI002B416A4B|nr:protein MICRORCHIDIA 7-like [Humulus lupulus]
MLLIEDKVRYCISLGYSEKSKLAFTIGQYGNDFKTSTMRLGADVIVFSCCHGNSGKRFFVFLHLCLIMKWKEMDGARWCDLLLVIGTKF